MKAKDEGYDKSLIKWKKAMGKVAPRPVEYDGSPQENFMSVEHDLSGTKQNPYNEMDVGNIAKGAQYRAKRWKERLALMKGRTPHPVNGNAEPVNKGRALSNNDTYKDGKYWNISAEVGDRLRRKEREDVVASRKK